MKASEAIRTRRSVRTFSDRPLDPGTADRILAFADRAENPFDLAIEWKIFPAAEHPELTSPVIVGAQAWIGGKMPLGIGTRAEEAFGYSFEKILLFAETLGLGSTIIAGTMDRSAFERAMKLEDGWIMPCVSPLGFPAERMSLRETVMRKGIRADTRLDFGELFFDGSFDKPLAPEKAGELAEVLELTRLSPSAVNKQPWRVVLDGSAHTPRLHFYEKRGKGYVAPNGWDIQRIDMGIALCHCVLALEEQGLRPSVTEADPGIALPDPENMFYCFTVSAAPDRSV